MSNALAFAISGRHYAELRHHLISGDGKEAVAVAVCGRAKDERRETLLVQEIIIVPFDACRIRSEHQVTWSPEILLPVLTRAMNLGLSIVKIHSHPARFDWFSETDDASDREFFDSVFGFLDTRDSQASLIMLPNGRLIGRAIEPDCLGAQLDVVRVAGDDFAFWWKDEVAPIVPTHARRIAQTFGDATYGLLRKLRIGIVGCSGTGSVVIEQLARNCVGELVLVDPESVEDRNLNRILNATRHDADNSVSKLAVMKRSIAAMCLGTIVSTFDKDPLDAEVVRALASCDILIGCMDSVDGRHILNKIGSYYVLPYIDMGVRIDADGKGGIDHVSGVVHTIQPGGSSLMSRGVYSQDDLAAAFMHRHDPATYATRREEGYVRNVRVDQPAVISVNMQVASTAINELLARVHPFRIEPNSNYSIRRIVLSDPAASVDEGDGTSCSIFNGYVGRGTQMPLLGMLEFAV